jgi:hypothetical protein
MSTSRRLAKFVPALALIALAVPSSASAQATRTWVSGVGDDANPCSRTAPCKTFAGAISKTANGGEINCLDPGGFGGLTIGKSLTIKCQYTEGGALVAGTNGIVINATASDKVTLRGLDINGAGGAGGAAPTSLNGIKVLSAGKVAIFDSEIYQFKAGVNINPTSPTTRVVLLRNHIHANDIGVIVAPGSNAATLTTATLRGNDVQDTTCGLVASSFGTNGSTPTTTDCGTASSATLVNQPVRLRVYESGVNENGFGIFTRGSNAVADVAYSEVTGNSSFGLRHLESSIIQGTSPGTNVVINAASDAFNGTPTTLGKRQAKAKRAARNKKLARAKRHAR